MAHISAGALDVVAPLTATDNVGAVVASRSAATARRALKRLRKENQRAAILLDAAQYTGNSRRVGATGMSEQWVNDQFAAGLTWAMTDSGYIPKGDGESLKSVLGWGTHSDRLLVCLPLATDWLTANLDTLIEVITATGRPVALVLESESDPLRHKETVAGLIEVLRCDVPTLLLRSDTSVLGALAHGAAAVSVGVRSGLRHLYPATDGDDEVFTPPPSVYVPRLQSYYMLDKVEGGITTNPQSPVWRCSCSVCHGRSLAWLFDQSDVASAAMEHSLAAQAQIARQLLEHPAPARPGEWRDRCEQAIKNHSQLLTARSQPWKPHKAVKAWLAATPRVSV
ncbi:hypothetical protein [uncultured Gordonia sp.]|nr:hypothetical protein [uncultured Gordonia sp.]